jgi:hypothetical protein
MRPERRMLTATSRAYGGTPSRTTSCLWSCSLPDQVKRRSLALDEEPSRVLPHVNAAVCAPPSVVVWLGSAYRAPMGQPDEDTPARFDALELEQMAAFRAFQPPRTSGDGALSADPDAVSALASI